MKSCKKKSMKPVKEKNTGAYFAQNITYMYHFISQRKISVHSVTYLKEKERDKAHLMKIKHQFVASSCLYSLSKSE